jgi:hypothetical protein
MSIKITRTHAVLAAIVLAITLAGVSYAAVPDGDGMISACRDQKGGLIVIDTEAGATCQHGQQLLSWNERGPVGPKGPTGPEGPEGPPGSAIKYFDVTIDGKLADTNYDGPVTIDHPTHWTTPGEYTLTFTESVATCRHWLNFETQQPRIGTARVLSSDTKKLKVTTHTPVGALINAPFTLHLAC